MLSYNEALEYMDCERENARRDARDERQFRDRQFIAWLRDNRLGRYVTREKCDYCDGTGTQSLGGAAIPAHEFAEDPDFAESYFRGDYDSPCPECKGQKIVLAVDDANLPPGTLERFERFQEGGEFYDDDDPLAAADGNVADDDERETAGFPSMRDSELAAAFGDEWLALTERERTRIERDSLEASREDGCGVREYRDRIGKGNLASYLRALTDDATAGFPKDLVATREDIISIKRAAAEDIMAQYLPKQARMLIRSTRIVIVPPGETHDAIKRAGPEVGPKGARAVYDSVPDEVVVEAGFVDPMTIVHECGHAVAYHATGDVQGNLAIRGAFDLATARGAFVTPYAATSRREFFAECFRAYCEANDGAPNDSYRVNKEWLRALHPSMFAFFERRFAPGNPDLTDEPDVAKDLDAQGKLLGAELRAVSDKYLAALNSLELFAGVTRATAPDEAPEERDTADDFDENANDERRHAGLWLGLQSMAPMPYFLASPCGGCGRIFTSNPEQVPCYPVNLDKPVGPPDFRLDPNGKKEPFCRSCFEALQRIRQEHGLERQWVSADAWEPSETVGFPRSVAKSGRVKRAALVYQNEIANVYACADLRVTPRDRGFTRLLLVGYLAHCVNFARGLYEAGAEVMTFWTTEAGDPALHTWEKFPHDWSKGKRVKGAHPASDEWEPIGEVARDVAGLAKDLTLKEATAGKKLRPLPPKLGRATFKPREWSYRVFQRSECLRRGMAWSEAILEDHFRKSLQGKLAAYCDDPALAARLVVLPSWALEAETLAALPKNLHPVGVCCHGERITANLVTGEEVSA